MTQKYGTKICIAFILASMPGRTTFYYEVQAATRAFGCDNEIVPSPAFQMNVHYGVIPGEIWPVKEFLARVRATSWPGRAERYTRHRVFQGPIPGWRGLGWTAQQRRLLQVWLTRQSHRKSGFEHYEYHGWAAATTPCNQLQGLPRKQTLPIRLANRCQGWRMTRCGNATGR